MKNQYITPAIKVLYLSPLCGSNNGIQVASVRQGTLNGPKIDEFEVKKKITKNTMKKKKKKCVGQVK